jgi:hypothetical protein
MAVTTTTQVTKSAATNDLTDLPTVKDELGIGAGDTSKDTWLKRGITQVSASIKNYCNKTFQVETVINTIDIERDLYPYQIAGGTRELVLTRWPVIAIASLLENGITLTEGTDFRADYGRGLLYRLSANGGNVVPWGALTVVVTYQAGYTARASQSTVVPGSPYSITVTNAASFVLDKGVTYANGTALVPVASAPTVGQYAVAAGVYTFNAADAALTLTISYTFESMPADLVEATLRLVTMRYKQKDRDPMMVSQDQPNIGSKRFWVGSQPGQSGPFPPDIASLLDSYRVPVVI